MIDLQDKIVIVTGGSGLLGREIVREIKAMRGTAVNVDVGISDDLSEGLLYGDVSDEHSIKSVISKIIDHYGRIDGWVNNAYPRTDDWGAKFENIPLSSWNENVMLQMSSVFLCCSLVLPFMLSQKSGSIVNVASIYGVVGPDFTVYEGTEMTMPAAYSAIKGGVVNFSRYLASYYGPNGIRVNSLSPGGVSNGQDRLFTDRYNAKVPLRRMAKPHEISAAACFLLSDAASYITGHNLMVDGGWTAI